MHGNAACLTTVGEYVGVAARAVLHVCDGVVPRRVGREVSVPFVYQLTGRIPFTAQKFGDRFDTVCAGTTDEHDCVHAVVVVEVVHFHGVGSVEQDDNLIALRFCKLDHFKFGGRKHLVVLHVVAFRVLCETFMFPNASVLRCVVRFFFRSDRQVGAFATAAFQYDDCRVGVVANGCAFKRRFRDNRFVYRKTVVCEHFLHFTGTTLQRRCSRAEYGHFYTLLVERQRVGFVLQQNGAFPGQFDVQFGCYSGSRRLRVVTGNCAPAVCGRCSQSTEHRRYCQGRSQHGRENLGKLLSLSGLH